VVFVCFLEVDAGFYLGYYFTADLAGVFLVYFLALDFLFGFTDSSLSSMSSSGSDYFCTCFFLPIS
jgi:hypothetical protein